MSLPAERQPGPWSSLIRVMTEPTATFQALAERPAIFPPYLLQTVAGIIGIVLLRPLSQGLIAETYAKAPPPGMSLQTFQVIGLVTGSIGTLIGPWLVGAVVALIASFFAQFQGGSVGFRRYFSMVGYAHVPLAIGGLIQTAVMSTAATMQQAQSMSISLAALAPQDANPVLKAFLTTLNPFDLFYYALLAIGFAALQRTRAAKSAAFVGTLYLFTFALAAIGLAFSKSRGF